MVDGGTSKTRLLCFPLQKQGTGGIQGRREKESEEAALGLHDDYAVVITKRNI